MRIITAELLLTYLEAEGIEYIFGVPSSTLVRLFDAVNEQSAIEPT